MATVLRSVPVRRIQFGGAVGLSRTNTNVPARPATPPMFKLAVSATAPGIDTPKGDNTPREQQQQPVAADATDVATLEVSPVNNNNNVVDEAPQPDDNANDASIGNSMNISRTHQTHLVHIDNFELMPAIRGVLNSPRSLHVCEKLNVHPTELVQRPLNDFLAHGVPRSVAALRREHFEKQRLEKIELVRKARDTMPIETQNEVQHAHANHQQTQADLAAAQKQKQQQHHSSSSSHAHKKEATAPTHLTTAPAYFSKRSTLATSPAAGGGRTSEGRFAASGNSNTDKYRRTGSAGRSGTPLSRSGSNISAAARIGAVRSSTPLARSNSATRQQQRPQSPAQQQPQPLRRTATPITRSNSAAPVESSPARDAHIRHVAARDQHRAECQQRAKMEQTTKDLNAVQRIAQQQRQREVTMRKLLRDRLLESEKKRLELEDQMAHAARQRKMREVEAERNRSAVIRNKDTRTRDVYKVEEAREMYKSPEKRRQQMASHPDARSASIEKELAAQHASLGVNERLAFR